LLFPAGVIIKMDPANIKIEPFNPDKITEAVTYAWYKDKKPLHPSELKGKNLIYKRYTFGDFEVISELVMIDKHFEKFLINDLVIKKDNGYVLN